MPFRLRCFLVMRMGRLDEVPPIGKLFPFRMLRQLAPRLIDISIMISLLSMPMLSAALVRRILSSEQSFLALTI